MTTEEVIDIKFKDEKTIWFDYIDYVKENHGSQRKGLMYEKKHGRFNFYIVNEGGEEILFCSLDNEEGEKVDSLLMTMRF